MSRVHRFDGETGKPCSRCGLILAAPIHGVVEPTEDAVNPGFVKKLTREQGARLKHALFHGVPEPDPATPDQSGEPTPFPPYAPETCVACGGPFGAFESRLYWSSPAHWMVRQHLGPIHSRCQRFDNAQEDALRKVLSSSSLAPSGESSPPGSSPEKPLLQERYWCGCIREARWTRCERHTGLEHDDEPKTRAEEERDRRCATVVDGVRCRLYAGHVDDHDTRDIVEFRGILSALSSEDASPLPPGSSPEKPLLGTTHDPGRAGGNVASHPLGSVEQVHTSDGRTRLVGDGLPVVAEGAADEPAQHLDVGHGGKDSTPARSSPEKPDAFSTLDRLAKLAPNWDSYGGASPDPRAIDTARKVMSLGARLWPVPMSNGGIQVEAHGDGIDIEIAIPPEGASEVLWPDDDRPSSPEKPESKESFLVYIDGDKYLWQRGSISGLDVRLLAAIPKGADVFLKVPDHPDEPIADAMVIDLAHLGRCARFSTAAQGSWAGSSPLPNDEEVEKLLGDLHAAAVEYGARNWYAPGPERRIAEAKEALRKTFAALHRERDELYADQGGDPTDPTRENRRVRETTESQGDSVTAGAESEVDGSAPAPFSEPAEDLIDNLVDAAMAVISDGTASDLTLTKVRLRQYIASLHQQLEEARKELRALHVGLHAATRPIVREAIDAARSSPERPNT